MANDDKTTFDADRYLKTGAHIGTKFKSGDMKRFIYKTRKDGLKVLSIATLDERIKAAAKFLASFSPERIAVVSRKVYGQMPVKVFAEVVDARVFTGRFVPGTFSNPQCKNFFEPKVVVVTEPDSDIQAIDEAKRIRVPVVALCSINNSTKNIDFVIPVNNKGRHSLALVYWLLAKHILLESGRISKEEDFRKKMEDFEHKLKEGEVEEQQLRRPARRGFRDYRGRPGFRGYGAGFGRREKFVGVKRTGDGLGEAKVKTAEEKPEKSKPEESKTEEKVKPKAATDEKTKGNEEKAKTPEEK